MASVLRTGGALLATALCLTVGSAAAFPARTTADLNLRNGPGVAFGVLTTIPDSGAVDVGGCRGGWCQVAYGRVNGWASRNYLAPVGGAVRAMAPAPAAPVPDPWYNVGYSGGWDDYPGWAGPSAYGYGVSIGFGDFDDPWDYSYAYYDRPYWRDRWVSPRTYRDRRRIVYRDRDFDRRRYVYRDRDFDRRRFVYRDRDFDRRRFVRRRDFDRRRFVRRDRDNRLYRRVASDRRMMRRRAERPMFRESRSAGLRARRSDATGAIGRRAGFGEGRMARRRR